MLYVFEVKVMFVGLGLVVVLIVVIWILVGIGIFIEWVVLFLIILEYVIEVVGIDSMVLLVV